MSKKAALPYSRHHILIYDEDWEFLEKAYGKGSANEALGISGAIRAIVHQKVLGLKAKINQQLDTQDSQGAEA